MATKTYDVLAPILHGDPDGRQHRLGPGDKVSLDANSDTVAQLLANDTIEDPAKPKQRSAEARVALQIRQEVDAGTRATPENADTAVAAEQAANQKYLASIGAATDKGKAKTKGPGGTAFEAPSEAPKTKRAKATKRTKAAAATGRQGGTRVLGGAEAGAEGARTAKP
ncbi:MAG: hypothetical protein M3O91_10250 [Chloroflexota bacterium]|nr:hypothetical protein [Chloroflexota bacterium]